MNKKPNVMIKGTKEGLTLHLNDQCSYQELKKELDEKLSAHYRETEGTPLLTVNIQTGNRYLLDDQVEELKDIVRQKRNLVVNEVWSNVITKSDADKLIDERNIETLTGVIRSGQVVEVPGDILIVGDVNPGGKVLAGGNIYILGSLKGIAHAGHNGNLDSVIVASKMVPSQLRIGGALNRAPDRVEEEDDHDMECAYIDDRGQIVVDRLQVLKHLRPNITSFKGGS
ncbi:septum site-determining protein MinC [Rossellomorea sp. AcN35-11]|nr:septum site-determining protein MinC [Rossellomorea aquimaris]NMH69866.1 septum site-determining protein MinC [Bacillus sp. RO3]WJV27892.1 septum site-determining protein MinC [Rossellomorea sp. AcN35-11]